MSEESLCARCARYTRTCCQDTEIHVTLADLRRISAHTDPGDCFEYRPPAHPVYDQRFEDPVWHESVFRRDGTRRVLKQQSNGDCVFLRESGCLLPADSRPLVCRLYPFDYTADGLLPHPASGCPVELLQPGEQLLQVLGMLHEEAEQLRAQLYAEIRESEPAEVLTENSR